MTNCKQTKCLTCACFSGSGIKLCPVCRTLCCDACDPTTCTRLYNHFKDTGWQDTMYPSIHVQRPTKQSAFLNVPFRMQWRALGHNTTLHPLSKPGRIDERPTAVTNPGADSRASTVWLGCRACSGLVCCADLAKPGNNEHGAPQRASLSSLSCPCGHS